MYFISSSFLLFLRMYRIPVSSFDKTMFVKLMILCLREHIRRKIFYFDQSLVLLEKDHSIFFYHHRTQEKKKKEYLSFVNLHFSFHHQQSKRRRIPFNFFLFLKQLQVFNPKFAKVFPWQVNMVSKS